MHQDLIAWRRHLHQNPETAFEEVETAKFVQEKLTGLGIEFKKNVGITGVVGLIKGEEPGPTVALRADMDALPIQDQKQVPYASKVKGKAHLCGHDSHTTMLLGAATLLSKNKPKKGQVKLIFQPAEENIGGAKKMIAEGVLQDPDVALIAGLHVHPLADTGYTAICPGISSANSDRFDLTIIGKGGHAAYPHMAVDSITVAAQVITALQQIVSRQVEPISPAVLTIGKIEGGFARNVIAPSVTINATVRTLDKNVRALMEQKIKQITKGICDAFGATYEIDYQNGYPSVFNDESLLPLLEQTANEILGEGKLAIRKNPSLGGEDFSYYAEQIPGIFFQLGIRNEEKGTTHSLHHPLFDIDEDALPFGAAMLAKFALNALEKLTTESTPF
ncbi:amidohydrolase [Bacillaceae bacterium Marseille-Q3522]|nr:amidohydrolase [Bacillaceae bacterium Marseille-Q3522]